MPANDNGAGKPAPNIYDTQWYADTRQAVANDKQSTFIVCDLLNEGREEFNLSIEQLVDLFNLEDKYEYYVVAMQYFSEGVRSAIDPHGMLGITAYRSVTIEGLPIPIRQKLLIDHVAALSNGKMYIDQEGDEVPATNDELKRRAVAQRALLGLDNGNGGGGGKPLKRYETTLPESLSYGEAVIQYKRFHPYEPIPAKWKTNSRFTWGLIFWEQESEDTDHD